MKYMLLIYDDEKGWANLSETQQQQAMGEYVQFTQQLHSAGQYVTSSQRSAQPKTKEKTSCLPQH